MEGLCAAKLTRIAICGLEITFRSDTKTFSVGVTKFWGTFRFHADAEENKRACTFYDGRFITKGYVQVFTYLGPGGFTSVVLLCVRVSMVASDRVSGDGLAVAVWFRDRFARV